MDLQLFVRHVAGVVIVDLQGGATIGRTNDLLDNQLRKLIDQGSSKILLNLTDVTHGFLEHQQRHTGIQIP
jgi:anti-anti-sigma regulatory factor